MSVNANDVHEVFSAAEDMYEKAKKLRFNRYSKPHEAVTLFHGALILFEEALPLIRTRSAGLERDRMLARALYVVGLRKMWKKRTHVDGRALLKESVDLYRQLYQMDDSYFECLTEALDNLSTFYTPSGWAKFSHHENGPLIEELVALYRGHFDSQIIKDDSVPTQMIRLARYWYVMNPGKSQSICDDAFSLYRVLYKEDEPIVLANVIYKEASSLRRRSPVYRDRDRVLTRSAYLAFVSWDEYTRPLLEESLTICRATYLNDPKDTWRKINTILGEMAHFTCQRGKLKEALALEEERMVILRRHATDDYVDYGDITWLLDRMALYHYQFGNDSVVTTLLEEAWDRHWTRKKRIADTGSVFARLAFAFKYRMWERRKRRFGLQPGALSLVSHPAGIYGIVADHNDRKKRGGKK